MSGAVALGVGGLGGEAASTTLVAAAEVAAEILSGPVGWVLLGGTLIVGGIALYHAHQQSKTDLKESEPDKPCADCAETATDGEDKPISRQKQDGHIRGTPQNENRNKQGKPTSTFDGDATEADRLTQEAWKKGKLVPGRTGVKDYDFGRRIGEGPRGEGQSTVRVHEDSTGRIHGHPSGPETP